MCGSASGSATTYTCALSPSLLTYTPNMVLHWRPDVNGAGGATTLKVDALGVVAVKQFDGTTNPSNTDIVANRLYSLWYGTVFRLMVPGVNVAVTAAQSGSELLCDSATGSATTYTCALSPSSLLTYTPNMVLPGDPM